MRMHGKPVLRFTCMTFLLLGVCHVFTTVTCTNKTTLHVGILMEMTKYWYRFYTNGFIHIIENVFAEIQQNHTILSDFDFKLTIKDTQGHNGRAAAELVHLLEEGEPKIAVIGPTRSGSLTVTGQVSPVYNIIQLSYIAVTSTIVDKSLYPTVFRINQATELLNPFRIKIMRHFGWRRVGTILHQDDISLSQMNPFHEMLHANNMTLAFSASFTSTENFRGILASFKQFDVRIIMGAVRGKFASALFCEAYKQGLYGASYVWILTGTTLYKQWPNHLQTECTYQELADAVAGHFTLDNLIMSPYDEPTISGKTPKAEIEEVREMLSNTIYSQSSYTPWIIDTVWSLVIGLNNSVKYLDEHGLSLHNYSYNPLFLDAIMKGMHDVLFDGVSVGPIFIHSFFFFFFVNKSIIAAYFDLEHDQLTWNVPVASLWKDKVPQDRFTYKQHLVIMDTPAVVVVACLNSLGCLASFTFLTFNIAYRQNRTIKMSSPMINNLIIGGCVLMYSVVLLGVADNFNTSDRCMVRTWTATVGFTLLFGALFSKTYRVYVMFRENRVRTKFIKDYHLFTMVGVMLLIDCVILVPWSSLHPLQRERVVTLTKDANDSNVVFSDVYLHCTHAQETYWIITVYVYKGLLLAFGVFLAWETRTVSVPELNDSKYIGACVYNVVVICIFGVPLAHVLPVEQRTLKFVLESCLIFFCTTICQCILFIPKIMDKNKVGGKMLAIQPGHTTSGSWNKTQTTGLPPNQPTDSGIVHSENVSEKQLNGFHKNKDGEDLGRLEEENKQLRHQIATDRIAEAKLRKNILSITGDVHFYRSGDEYVVFQRHASSRQSMADLDAPDTTSNNANNGNGLLDVTSDMTSPGKLHTPC